VPNLHEMKSLTFIFALLLSNFIWGQDTTKVLFIGNSFTSQNNLPNLFFELAQGAGKNVVIASHMPGGISVGDTVQGTSAHMFNPVVYALIKSNNWDYLVLQDNQGRFCLPYGHFSGSSLVIEGHLKILDSLLYYHPCAHMLWYAGYGPKDGYPPYGNTGIALIDSIYQNYQFLNDTAQQIIAPIGPAFKRIITQNPSMDLWSSDAVHPSLFGSTLVANVIYASIFKSSPMQSTYNPGITSFEDSLLKSVAFETTIDSMNYTGLNEITPTITQVGNLLNVSGFQNCEWYFNGMPYLSNNCESTINQNGLYYAIVNDNNGCSYITLSQQYNTTGHQEDLKNSLLIYPNPVEDVLFIQSTINYLNYKITDINGKLLITDHKKMVDVSYLNTGIYFLTIAYKEDFIHLKLMKK